MQINIREFGEVENLRIIFLKGSFKDRGQEFPIPCRFLFSLSEPRMKKKSEIRFIESGIIHYNKARVAG